MAIAPLTFTGVSSFSNDFQTILDRAQKIANLPVQQLQNKDADVIAQKTLFAGLAGTVNAFAASLAALGTVAENRGLSATSSDTSKVTVSNTGASLATTYTLNSITSAATVASERSSTGYVDAGATPVSAAGDLKLRVGSEEYDFSLTTNTLVGLRDKINALGAGVTASILTTSDGNFLSVSANGTGVKSLQLIDDPEGAATNLLTADNPGTNAVFKLNGIDIDQPGNVVNTVIPGLTFTIKAASNTPVTLSLATDRSQLSGALQSFVTNYNALRSQVNTQIGPAAGLLSGNSIVSQISNKLRETTSYRISTGSVRGLSDLGVEFDASGIAKFNSDAFNALSDSAVSEGFAFVGSATSGLGGLSQAFEQIGDPNFGLIQLAQEGLERIDKSLQERMAAINERITVAQNALAAKLHAADALLASLASQQSALTASLQGLSLTLYGKNKD